MYQMRELLYQGRSVHRHLDLRNEGYSLYHLVFLDASQCVLLFFYCFALDKVGHLSW